MFLLCLLQVALHTAWSSEGIGSGPERHFTFLLIGVDESSVIPVLRKALDFSGALECFNMFFDIFQENNLICVINTCWI